MFLKYTKNQRRVLVVFLLYLAVLFYLVLFSETYRRGGSLGDGYAYNLEPFKEIRRFCGSIEQLGFRVVFVNLAGNILAFIPFAFLLPVVSEKTGGFFQTVFLTFFLSLCIECAQLVTKVGSFDVDDLILNTAGGLIGYLLHKFALWIWMRRKSGAGTEE